MLTNCIESFIKSRVYKNDLAEHEGNFYLAYPLHQYLRMLKKHRYELHISGKSIKIAYSGPTSGEVQLNPIEYREKDNTAFIHNSYYTDNYKTIKPRQIHRLDWSI